MRHFSIQVSFDVLFLELTFTFCSSLLLKIKNRLLELETIGKVCVHALAW